MVRWLFAHLNIGLPEDLHDRIKKHPEIRWASLARELLTRYLDEYEKFKEAQFKQMPGARSKQTESSENQKP